MDSIILYMKDSLSSILTCVSSCKVADLSDKLFNYFKENLFDMNAKVDEKDHPTHKGKKPLPDDVRISSGCVDISYICV